MLEELKNKIKELAANYKLVAAQKLAEFNAAPQSTKAAPEDQPQSTEASAPAKSISGSVGKGGNNAKADVITVQTLLKDKGYPITVDGDCGNKTIAAIADFQTKKFGKADGRIDPNGSTWKALTASGTVTPPKPVDPKPVDPKPVDPAPVNPTPNNGQVTNVLTAKEIDKSGDWAKRPAAKRITATPAEVSAFIGKCNQPGSPTQLPVKPKTKVTTFTEEFKYLEGANVLITGKSLVPRPAMYDSKGQMDLANINKVYGTVVAAHVGENGALDTPEARKSYADFESKNIVKISAPYTLYYDGKPVSSMRLNKKVASSMSAALTEVLAFYGAEMIHKLGIDMYGGGFVYRKMRGSTKPSIHAWGCAVDFCAELNGLKDLGGNALFSQAPYAAFVDIMEKHGWYNQGRGKGNDFMHFQAVCY